MSGRTLLDGALKEALPEWQIVSDSRVLDTVRKPGACVLWTEKRIKSSRGTGWFQDELTLFVLTGVDKPELVDDDLDELLLTVAAVLEPLDAFYWESAERATLDEKFLGWRIPITCVVKVTTEPEPEPE